MRATLIAINLLVALDMIESTGLIDAKVSGTEISKMDLTGPYTIYRQKMTWSDARGYCEKTEGHLATFESPQDAVEISEKIYEVSEKVTSDFLRGKTKAEFGLNRRYWIGLTDIGTGEGKWAWAGKGTPLKYKSMWYAGQPDHIDEQGKYIGRPEHCVGLWNPVFHKGKRRHSFADMECDLKYYFICEKDDQKIQAQKEYAGRAGKSTGGKSGRMIKLGQVQRFLRVTPTPEPKTEQGRSSEKGEPLINNDEPEAGDEVKNDELVSSLKNIAGFKETFQDSSEETNEKDSV